MTKKNYNFYLWSFLFVSFVLVNTLMAQTVTIKGTIVDSLNNDPLPGANVILPGTSIGAATDVDGKFLLRNIPVGSYRIRASYVGYDPQEFTIELVAGRTLELEFELNPVSLEGQTVVITAQASGQKEAINQQLSSLEIKNVVSMARISGIT